MLDRLLGMRSGRTLACALLIWLVVFVRPAEANVELPMLVFYLPPAWILLLPIVGLEAVVGVRRYGLPIRDAFLSQAYANGFSTLLGVPLAWACLASLQILTASWIWNPRDPNCYLQAATQPMWLMPPLRQCSWVVPIALVAAFVVFFILSVISEYAILRVVRPSLAPRMLRGWVSAANAASYVVLGGFVAVSALWPDASHGPCSPSNLSSRSSSTIGSILQGLRVPCDWNRG